MTYFPLRQTTCFFIPLVAPCKPLLALLFPTTFFPLADGVYTFGVVSSAATVEKGGSAAKRKISKVMMHRQRLSTEGKCKVISSDFLSWKMHK